MGTHGAVPLVGAPLTRGSGKNNSYYILTKERHIFLFSRRFDLLNGTLFDVP